MTTQMTRAAILIVLAGAVGCTPGIKDEPQAAGPSITVDWSKTYQTIVGFGGTMGWIHPHPRHREKVFDLLFAELGVSVLRIRALGGEGGDEESLEPANDNDDPDTFNWDGFPVGDTEAKNAIIIKAALERGVKTIIPVTWSPPGWMKDTGERAGGGSLKPELLDEYAELWAAYVIGMQREFGITVRHISIQNEPDLTYYYPTCWWPAEFYARAVAAVSGRLEKEGLNVKVLGPDTCRIYNMPRYVEAMEEASVRPGAPVLTHLYDFTIPYERVHRDPERWRRARDFARRYSRPLWFMETANYLSYGARPASYEEAIVWAQKIHWALTEGDCEVVCWWGLFFDKKGQALIYCRESEYAGYEITPKFYTSMNYFRFVRPGMVRCAATATDEDLLVTAFKGDGGRRVIIVVNPADEAKELGGAPVAAGWECYATTPDKGCLLTPCPDGRPSLPRQSVTTFVHEAQDL